MTGRQLVQVAASGLIDLGYHTFDGHRMAGGKPVLVEWTADELTAD